MAPRGWWPTLLALGGALLAAAARELEPVRELRTAMTAELQLGIDLGTTLSVAAICSDGNVSVVRVDGEPTTPSAVWFNKGSGIVVGRKALAARARDPGYVVYGAKRVIGLDHADPDRLQAVSGLPFDFAPVSKPGEWHGATGFRLPNDRVVTPEQIGAIVLKRLKHAAEQSPILDWMRRTLGFTFQSVTVSVPVTFTDAQRKATIRACRMAGFSREVRLIEEPIAAAVAFGLGREKATSRVLVFDIGGGTLDIALLYFNAYSGTFYVETTSGESHLGGEDFDRILADLALAQAPDAALAEAIRASPSAMQELLGAAEAAKRLLSYEPRATVCLPDASGAPADEPGTVALSRSCAAPVVVTVQAFEQASAAHRARAMDAVQRALDDAGLARDVELDVVLVGGSSRIPSLRTDLAEFLPRATQHFRGVDPDQAVAIGAAKSWGCAHSGRRT